MKNCISNRIHILVNRLIDKNNHKIIENKKNEKEKILQKKIEKFKDKRSSKDIEQLNLKKIMYCKFCKNEIKGYNEYCENCYTSLGEKDKDYLDFYKIVSKIVDKEREK